MKAKERKHLNFSVLRITESEATDGLMCAPFIKTPNFIVPTEEGAVELRNSKLLSAWVPRKAESETRFCAQVTAKI